MAVLEPQRGLAAPARAFLAYLQEHIELRNRIRAFPNRTVAYVGNFDDGASWRRLLRRQLSDPRVNDYEMLSDVLKRIPCPRELYTAVGLVTPPSVNTLLDFVKFLAGGDPYPGQVRWDKGGFVVWRAVSGIFMSNATGRVRLMIGDERVPQERVFFKTEVFVLERNPNIDLFAKQAVHQIRIQMKSGALKGTVELM